MILVGVDFREGSRAALAYARALSLASGLPVESVYVREYGEDGLWRPDPEEEAWMARAELSAAQLRTRRGIPWVELVRYARERKATLIVVGRHGASGPQPSFLGATALRLATHAPDPVLLVSHGPTLGPGAEGVHDSKPGLAKDPETSIPGRPTHSDAN